MRKLLALLAFVAVQAQAAFVVADVAPGTTHCGWYVNTSTVPNVLPVDAGGATCRLNVGAYAPGSHTVSADARSTDPVWGSLPSAKSLPLTFTKPSATGTAPSNLRLVP